MAKGVKNKSCKRIVLPKMSVLGQRITIKPDPVGAVRCGRMAAGTTDADKKKPLTR